MVAGFAEVIGGEETWVAKARFEPVTSATELASLLKKQTFPLTYCELGRPFGTKPKALIRSSNCGEKTAFLDRMDRESNWELFGKQL
jgi:hypothetical protein